VVVSIRSTLGHEAMASDGSIGHLFDYFFDDEVWGVRYVVIDTGTWIPSEKRLLALNEHLTLDTNRKTLFVKYPRETIEASPAIDLAKPVTLDEERLVRRHYGAWPHWAPYVVGAGPHKMTALRDKAGEDLERHEDLPGYTLHSFKEIHEFRVRFADDNEESVKDLLVKLDDWAIVALVVESGLPPNRTELAVPMKEISGFDRETRVFTSELVESALDQPSDVSA